MVRAVIFDWYGTLAQWQHGSVSNYAAIFQDHGFAIDATTVDAYHSRWDGVDHVEFSASRDAYRSWTLRRLKDLARQCGVPATSRLALANALLDADSVAPMVLFPETLTVLSELRRHGITIGVCSNWGWDLEEFLEATGAAPLVDVPVTSARAGYRKPHPGIYETTLAALRVTPSEVIFVGDSWGPDVLGPISVGMRSVHVCREPTKPQPALVSGAHRVTSLEGVLALGLVDAGPSSHR